MLKKSIKRILEYVAAYTSWHRRTPGQPTLLILGYHRILPEDHPEYHIMQPGMRVRPETLEMHIRVLKKYFDIVDLGDWVERAQKGESLPRKAVALTFDDGWVDNYEYAFPILKRENAHATIFLVSSLVDSKSQFWPERVANILSYIGKTGKASLSSQHNQWFRQYGVDVTNDEAFSEDNVDRLINTLKSYSDEQVYESLKTFSDIEEKIESPVQILSRDQLTEMHESGLVKYGAHTKHHFRLNKIVTHDRLVEEVVGCQQELAEILGEPPRHFCYPNGNYNDKSLALVKKHYLSACSIERGTNTPESDFSLLRRVMLHDDVSCSPVSFQAKVSTLL